MNLWGADQITRALLPDKVGRGSGSIVCISSVARERGGGMAGGVRSSASKEADLGFVKGLARELGAENIRVNAVSPGFVDTNITLPFMAPDRRQLRARQTVLNRPTPRTEIAGVCLFQASDLAVYISGAPIDVNGGLNIH